MIYIHQVGIINYRENQSVDIRAECKQIAPKFVRRTDDFIQLAILGVEQISRNTSIPSNTALYLTSGQGNTGVFTRLCRQQLIDKLPPKPVDFINSLSNTAGFYVSQFLGLENKNNNLSHRCFVVEMALILAKSELLLDREEWILLGGVDQKLSSQALSRAVLGLSDALSVGQGSNWMLLNKSKPGALASIELSNQEMNKAQLYAYLDKLHYSQDKCQLGFSMLMDAAVKEDILVQTAYPQFNFESQTDFYETIPLYVINKFVLNEQGKLIFIDCFLDRYRVLVVEVY